MGRARQSAHGVAASFEQVLGDRRGRLGPDTLGAYRPNDTAERVLRTELAALAAGDFDGALTTLAQHGQLLRRPLVKKLLDATSEELAMQGRMRRAGKHSKLLEAAGIHPKTASTLAFDNVESAGGVHLLSARTGAARCGLPPAMLGPAPRGAWKEASYFSRKRCMLCESFAAGYPECNASRKAVLAGADLDRFEVLQRQLTHEQLAHALTDGPVSFLESCGFASQAADDALLDIAADQAAAEPARVLEAVLGSDRAAGAVAWTSDDWRSWLTRVLSTDGDMAAFAARSLRSRLAKA